MARIVVRGGVPLRGTVQTSGSKNASLPQMAACMLAPGKSTLRNVPALRDVDTMGEMLNFLGVRTERIDDHIDIDASDFSGYDAPYDMVRRMRASFYVLGPMLARLKRARVSLPGGCAIGARPIDIHLRGFEALGATIRLEGGYIVAEGENMRGAELSLSGEFGSSVGATCNVLMAAVLTPGRTVLRGCAMEPEVGELARMLNLMGARVTGIDSPTLEIDGVEELRPITYATIADRIEAGTFLVAGAATRGEVMVLGARPDHLNAVLDKLIRIGAKIEIHPTGIKVYGNDGPFRATDITTMPFPGFPTDMQAQFMAMLGTAEGESVIHEGIYPDRFIHAAELARMGANIQVGRGEARVRGVRRITGAPLMASDLRASAALVIAALMAEGESVINRVYHIERGYENIEGKLSALGAEIWREGRERPTEPMAALAG